MTRRYSINLWLETASAPQAIAALLNTTLRPLTSHMGMSRVLLLNRRTFMIMVPANEECARFVAPGSAIIGAWYDTDIEVYYEGAIHQQSMSFEDKCLHAADRFVTRYPTIAKALLSAADLKQIGTYSFNDDGTDRRVAITDAEAFMKWTGLPVPEEG